MAVIRAPRPEQHYTQIRNDVLRDERLSYRARGILAVILSMPDNWTTSAERLCRQGQEGRDAIRTALGELEAAGYLKRERRQDDRGRWSTQAVVYDTPQAHPVQDALLEVLGAPTPGNPSSVASPQVNDITAGQTDDGKPAVGFPGPTKNTTTNTPSLREGSAAAADATPAKDVKPAHAIAKAVYEAAEGMVNFLAVRGVAAKGLKVQGASQESVQAALLALYAEGRPLTATTLGQRLQKAQGKVQPGGLLPPSDWSAHQGPGW